ncbi:glycosyltransferase [Thermoproteus tenax]|uniref:Glycosyltransferase (Type2) n=1 Tax=Thermoproteus tenax (strain ATCC 35583 / DSM 2078 / JCM 9277 / NBRC 100435 / Kra 1) TaxID=768679 RepID=G4RK93_THETK|nr:glycosyltransferase [Thermoproteus tenax]CCC81988.1 glycosyltransferase (type2) [Thermoproteus tenax Kra 1]
MGASISFYGTVYNSASYIRASLASVCLTAAKLSRIYGLPSEVVVVDAYSTDGTYELARELARAFARFGVTVRLARLRSSRGLGRDLAMRLARGDYLIFVSDFDVAYDHELLADLITNYVSDELLNDKCLYILITPQSAALRAGGLRDLNRAEDVEFASRVASNCVMLPILSRSYESIPLSRLMRSLELRVSLRFFVTTFVSERRYVKSLLHYLRRELRNKLDTVRALGYTPTRIVREGYYVRGLRWLKLVVWIAYHLALWLANTMMGRTPYMNSKYLNNGSACDVAMFLNYIALTVRIYRDRGDGKLLSRVREFTRAWLKERGSAIAYYLAHSPDSLKLAFKGQFFLVGRDI